MMADLGIFGTGFEVVLEDKPFAEGTERCAYKGEVLCPPFLHPTGEKVVVKTFKKDYEPGTYGEIFSYNNIDISLRIARLAQSYATTFNKNIQPPQELEVLWPKIVRVQSAPGIPPGLSKDYVIAETFLDGDFIKFNSNTGWENSKYKDSAILAFSHYTWVNSRGQLLICDLQGIEKNNKIVLTDIVIMSPSDSFQYGYTDLGIAYINQFLDKHKCNQYCKKFLSDHCKG